MENKKETLGRKGKDFIKKVGRVNVYITNEEIDFVRAFNFSHADIYRAGLRIKKQEVKMKEQNLGIKENELIKLKEANSLIIEVINDLDKHQHGK